MHILADASLPLLPLAFPPPFRIFYYHQEAEVAALLPGMDILLCRSTLKVNTSLLQKSKLRYIATASSGVDHIDEALLQSKGILLFSAKGCNALAVADYVLTCLAYLEQNCAFQGKTIGVVGLGAVGSEVAKRLAYLGFSLIQYDPLRLSHQSASYQELFTCDLLCLHANLHDNKPHASRNLIADTLLSKLKPYSAIINASRGEILCESALLQRKAPLYYCTDVYANEPNVQESILHYATLCTPHIAGHSAEAKKRAIYILSYKLHQACGLPPPLLPPLAAPGPSLSLQSGWQQKLLSYYHPLQETLQLQKNPDRQNFLSLRKAHKRHEICWEEK